MNNYLLTPIKRAGSSLTPAPIVRKEAGMSKPTVLVVDDETSFLDIMNLILPRAGFDIITCAHGTEGLQMIYDCKPDLALLDDMLPGISGGDICLALKSDPTFQHMPVVLYSARSEERRVGKECRSRWAQ